MSQRSPLLYRFVADRSGQSSPLAVVVLVGITIAGSGLVLGFGTKAFTDTNDATSLSLNEQSMSKLDSEAAVVALGSADTRRIRLGDDGNGQYDVRGSSSWLRIEHRNHTGSGASETIYNESLGSVVYESGSETVAYEGGGVWRTAEPGNTTMVSSPEFRYRGATLTLPVIRVTGDADSSGSGRSVATVETGGASERVFPSTGTANPGTGAPYDDGTPYDNPVTNGTLVITVHSPHYAGWADYFRSRTDGNVSVDPGATEVTVTLGSGGSELGVFTPPSVGDHVQVSGMGEGHALDTFTLALEAHNTGSAFNNRVWGFEYEDPEQRFAVQVNTAQGDEKCQNSGDTYDGDIQLTVYYDNRTDGVYQAFEDDYTGADDGDPITVHCDGGADGGPPVLHLDLTHTASITYQEPTNPGGYDEQPFQSADGDASLRDGFEPTAHRPGADDGVTLDAGTTTKSLEWVTGHYLGQLAPSFTLTTVEGPGSDTGNTNNNAGVDEGASTGELRYDLASGSEFIRYIHVTGNEIRVRLAG